MQPSPSKYNKAQWIDSFQDQLVLLRPHLTRKLLDTIGLMAWGQHGTKGEDPQKAAREHSQSMDQKPGPRID